MESMDQWESPSENESTVSSRSRYSESSQHHCTQQLASIPISISAAKFIRKRRARMLGISSSSSSSPSPSKIYSVPQRPVRLRRSLVAKTEEQSSTMSSSTSSSTGSSTPSSNGKKDKKKPAKVLPPPLNPIQLEIRRLYDNINRSFRKTLREGINKSWDNNLKLVSAQTKQHDRFQSLKAVSSMTSSLNSNLVTSDDILQATRNSALNKLTTAERVKVSVMSDAVSPSNIKQGNSGSTKQDQRVPVTTIGNVSQIPPVLDWTAIPHNMHEDDGKFLTNIPFLGDEFIDKDSNFIDEMVTLYEGKVHEDKDSSSFKKMPDEVLYMLVQTMIKIEADVPGVFQEIKEEQIPEPTDLFQEEKKVPVAETVENEGSPKKTTFSDVAAKLFTQADSPIKSEPVSLEPSEQVEVISESLDVDMPELSVEKKEDSIAIINTDTPPDLHKVEVVEGNDQNVSPESVNGNNQLEESNPSVMEVLDESEPSFINSCENNKPSENIFTVLSTTFKGIGSPNEIKEKYENAEKSRNAPPLPILPNGMEQQNPESYSIPNIEGPFAKYLPKEATMHAYQFLFCRRCFTYDCKRHTGDDQVDSKHYKRNRQMTPATSASSSGAGGANAFNFVCECTDCWQKKVISKRSAEEVLSEWTPGDRSLFGCFIESFPSNYCFIAYLMRNKSCSQVKEYADLENVPKEETCPRDMVPRSKAKHRKKLSANSSSKKNVTRRWINKVKKTEEKEGGIKTVGGILPIRYMPCLHENGEECDASCTCRINNTSCEKFCTCALTCPYRFPGCKCLSTCDSKRCICFAAARECDPDLCLGCGANEVDLEKISCHNVNIQRKLHKHLLMGKSDISGWGIYIKNDAQKGEFIAEYRGELISYDESERRGHVYDKIQHTFLFELNDHFVVDATRKGNKARFVNSSKNPNCEVKRMLVNGDHRIGIYAKRFIEAGEELFYDYEDVLEKQQKAAEAVNRKRKE